MVSIYNQLMDQTSFSHAEKQIAEYILKNQQHIMTLSIQQLGKETYSSATTVTRFCKKLGFSGFKEFKTTFIQAFNIQRIKETEMNGNYPFAELDNECDIANKMANLTKNTISACQLLIDTQLIKKVVNRMIQADNLIAIGVSDSFLRILDFQNKMLKINQFVKVSFLQPEQTFLCSNATEKDAALIVSYSGKTAEMINEAKILRQRCVYTVVITSQPKSPLAKLSDVVLLLPSEPSETSLPYSFSSQISIDYMLNVLYSCLYRKDYQLNWDFLQQTRKKYLHS